MTVYNEITPAQRQLADFGRRMMEVAPRIKDDVKSNMFARVGNMLTTYGAPWGAREKDFTPEYRAIIQEAEQMFAEETA